MTFCWSYFSARGLYYWLWLGQPRKKPSLWIAKTHFSWRSHVRDFWDNSTATFCTQNSWVNLFYPQYKAVQQMHVIWKTVLRCSIMRPNCRNRDADGLVAEYFVGRSVPTSLLPENRCDIYGFMVKKKLVQMLWLFRRNPSNLEVRWEGGWSGQ